jgi:hypothetical protein
MVMNPRHGEVWLVDMGMAAKTRPAVVLLADNLNAPRSPIIHVPITRQNRGSELEYRWGICLFSIRLRWPTRKALERFPPFDLKSALVSCQQRIEGH